MKKLRKIALVSALVLFGILALYLVVTFVFYIFHKPPIKIPTGKVSVFFNIEAGKTVAITMLEKYSFTEPKDFYKTYYADLISDNVELSFNNWQSLSDALKQTPSVESCQVNGFINGVKDTSKWQSISIRFSPMVTYQQIKTMTKDYPSVNPYYSLPWYEFNVPIGQEEYYAKLLEKEEIVVHVNAGYFLLFDYGYYNIGF